MAYWKKPSKFYNQSIDWTTTRSFRSITAISIAPDNIRNTLADVFWNFGKAVNMDWGEIGVEGSYAVSQVAINTLASNGFTVTSERNYSYNPVLSSLQNSRPVYIKGYSHKTEHKFLGINWWSKYKGGHAWLIDGYYQRQRQVTVTYTYRGSNIVTGETRGPGSGGDIRTETITYVESPEFFHNNFGWGRFDNETSNGYYTTGLFDTNNGPDLSSNTRSDEDGNFIYDLGIWTDIR